MITNRTYKNGYEPTLAGLKLNLRLAGSGFDTDLELKLKAAILQAEHFIGEVIARSVFTDVYPFCHHHRLRTPVNSVTSVVVDGNTLDASEYEVTPCGDLALDSELTGESVTVVYDAGPATVVEDVKQAIYLHASALFTNPVDSVEALPKASQNLLLQHRKWGLRDAER